MPNTKWAAIVVVSEIIDGKFEVSIEDPSVGRRPFAHREFAVGENPQRWINREMGKHMRAWLKDYHRVRPPVPLHPPVNDLRWDDWVDWSEYEDDYADYY